VQTSWLRSMPFLPTRRPTTTNHPGVAGSWWLGDGAGRGPFELHVHRQLGRLQVHVTPGKPEDLAMAQAEDENVVGVPWVPVLAGGLQEAACFIAGRTPGGDACGRERA
jgi:hypothetical protein